MSDFELHNLCREKYYLAKYCLQTEAILNSGKFNKLNDLLPDLKEKVSACSESNTKSTLPRFGWLILKYSFYQKSVSQPHKVRRRNESPRMIISNNIDLFKFLSIIKGHRQLLTSSL